MSPARASLPRVNREMLRLAWPNVLSNVSVPLLSSVDTALMGHLSAAHLGAVGLAGMLFNFAYWNFGFLRMGTTGLTAQAFGEVDRSAQARVLGTAGLLALAIAALLLALQAPLFALAEWGLNVPPDQRALVADYYRIRIWAAPATLLLYVANGWFFGQQNARLPLALAVAANVVNVGVSVALVRGAGWSTAGVAAGTVVAQYLGLALATLALWRRYPWAAAALRDVAYLRLASYRRLLRVNADIFLRTLSLTFAFAFLYARAAAAGELALAVATLLLQFLNWMSYAVDGFAYAAEAMVGKYTGAANRVATRRAIHLAHGWGFALAAAFALVYGLAGGPIARLFTDAPAVLAATADLLPFLIALPLLGSACYIWDGVFVGLTATRAMRDTMFLALVAYLTAYYALRGPLGEGPAVWWALLVFLAARGALQSLWWWRRGLGLR